MYCNQCGNIVMDGALFCAFCGAKCSDAAAVKVSDFGAAASQPVPEAAPAAESIPLQTGSESVINENVTAVSAPISENATPMVEAAAISEPASFAPVQESIVNPAPTAEAVTPTYSTEHKATYYGAAPVQQGAPDFSVEIPAEPQQQKPVKYYTFGHLMLCLAAVGVMALVAGVFAGLYFSVI